MTLKTIQITHELKEALRIHSFHTKQPMSEVICSIVRDYAAGLVTPPEPIRPTADTAFKYEAPPEYDTAMQRALSDGVTLTQVIRDELARRVG